MYCVEFDNGQLFWTDSVKKSHVSDTPVPHPLDTPDGSRVLLPNPFYSRHSTYASPLVFPTFPQLVWSYSIPLYPYLVLTPAHTFPSCGLQENVNSVYRQFSFFSRTHCPLSPLSFSLMRSTHPVSHPHLCLPHNPPLTLHEG